MPTTSPAMTPADRRHLILAAMLDAQESALSDGEPGGAEDEVKALMAMLNDEEGFAKLMGGPGTPPNTQSPPTEN